MNRFLFKFWFRLHIFYAFIVKLFNQPLDSVYDECIKLNKQDNCDIKLNYEINCEITRRNK